MKDDPIPQKQDVTKETLLQIVEEAEVVCYGEGIGPGEKEFNHLRLLIKEIPVSLFNRIFRKSIT